MSIKLRTLGILIIILALLAAIVAAVASLARTSSEYAEATEYRSRALRVAGQIRRSSDELTRMARSFIATGDPRFKQYFQRIIDIRDGQVPRPQNYDNVYWDYVIANDSSPTPLGKREPIVSMLDKLNLTDQEFAKLAQAKNNSDALILLERNAFDAMEGRNPGIDIEIIATPTSESNLKLAGELLFGDAYHQAKIAIMQPIGEFIELLDKRTEQTVSRLDAAERQATTILFALVLSTIAIVLFAGYHVRRHIVSPLEQLAVIAREIEGGKFETRVEATRREDEIGILGQAFNDMLDKIRGSMDDLQAANAEVAEANSSLEQRVKDRTRELELTNEELSDFAYVVSHDIKAPLRAIHNYADFLTEDLSGTLEDEQQELLDAMGAAVQEGESLIENVLELSRIGRKDAPRKEVDCGELIGSIWKTLAIDGDATLELPEGPAPIISASPTLFRQVLQNLIGNGIKFNSKDDKLIRIGWDNGLDGMFTISVTDNGIGIEERFQEKIFSVFERLHSKDEFDGNGMGLAIVKKAVNQLGGTIALDSTIGVGATFTVSLPNNTLEISE